MPQRRILIKKPADGRPIACSRSEHDDRFFTVKIGQCPYKANNGASVAAGKKVRKR